MSETLTQVKTPLWKPETKSNNIEFLSSFKRLEKEDFQTYQIIDQKEGYVCQDHNYEYRVGKSQYGLWASRRRLELSQSQTITPPKTVENGNLPVRHTNDEKIITPFIGLFLPAGNLNAAKITIHLGIVYSNCLLSVLTFLLSCWFN